MFLLKYPTKCLSGRPSADLILCRLPEIFVEFDVINVMHIKGIGEKFRDEENVD